MGDMTLAQAMIAAMITPALLILAAGSLIGIALTRLARIVDRVRTLSERSVTRPLTNEFARQRIRASHTQWALDFFFCSIVLFVISGFGIAIDRLSDDRLTWLPVLATTLGMALIVAGTLMMMLESRLARRQVNAEIDALQRNEPPTP